MLNQQTLLTLWAMADAAYLYGRMACSAVAGLLAATFAGPRTWSADERRPVVSPILQAVPIVADDRFAGRTRRTGYRSRYDH